MNQFREENCLPEIYRESFHRHWKQPLFSDYEGLKLTYGEVAAHIVQIHQFFREQKICPGDRIALLGRNSSNWGISFLAVFFYGAVVVPVLPDFNPEDMHHILTHSQSRLLFVGDSVVKQLNRDQLPDLCGVISLQSFDLLTDDNERIRSVVKLDGADVSSVGPDELRIYAPREEDPCLLSYTSGTSGFTKGVVLPMRSLWSNIVFARKHMPLESGNRIVSFLPMAHVFGLLFEFLFPVTMGCHITFLTRIPGPRIVLQAFREIRPHVILSVPLVIEKIYQTRILPVIQKPLVKVLLKVPLLNKFIYDQIGKKLTAAFGGRFHEIVIGGAALSNEVEQFFRKVHFPFTVGYGMTECGPLISYAAWNETRPGSTGKLVDRMEIRVNSADPYCQPGEILVRGANCMTAYFRNPGESRKTIDADGWLHTGDLGVIDHQGFVYLKGRCKNMLLGPSGQNIYPEEIEAKLNQQALIRECVVVQRENKLIGLVYVDPEEKETLTNERQRPEDLLEAVRVRVNQTLPVYSQLRALEMQDNEFEKTPKRNIRRFRYQ